MRDYIPEGEGWQPTTLNDRWVIELVFKGKRNGFFVEAGASHGGWGSSTWALEKDFGWTGLLVEPVDHLFEKLKKTRLNSKCFNVCLYNENKEVDFVQFGDESLGVGGGVGYSGIPENWHPSRKVSKTTNHIYKKLKKQAMKLEKILEAITAPSIIDYLALDIESAEEKVLKNFPFDKYKFKAISVEGSVSAIYSILKPWGYEMVFNPFTEVTYEGYFVHKDFINITYNA